VRNKEWEFIINPIVDIGFGALGEADFLPAARLAAISATTASSASNIILTSARSVIFRHSSSSSMSSSR
jgi:hypothetical protein